MSYRYQLEGADAEILAYHWHPSGRSHETDPHLHLSAGAGVTRRELTTAHLPTGWVYAEEIFRLLIREFGVRPLRSDWAALLLRSGADRPA